jgi:hypothetical protein
VKSEYLVSAVLALALTATPVLAQDDPDDASAPALNNPSANKPFRSGGKAVGTCDPTNLVGNWRITIDHDLGTPGTRAAMSFCHIKINSHGVIATRSCVRQSTDNLGDTLSGKIKIGADCVVENNSKSKPLTYHDEARGADSLLKLDATMSGERTRFSGMIVGFNTGQARGSFDAVLEP